MTEIINKGGVKQVAIGDLKHHPRNPNEGDVGAVHGSIEANGFYGALIVQESTGYVLAGNHRLEAARQAGLKKLPVIYVDVDDERAERILLADNRTAALASQDKALLADVLRELAETPAGLDGTGYDGDDLDAIIKDVEGDHDFIERERESAGGAYEEQYGVIVVCDDEEHQARVYEQLTQLGHACKVVVT